MRLLLFSEGNFRLMIEIAVQDNLKLTELYKIQPNGFLDLLIQKMF